MELRGWRYILVEWAPDAEGNDICQKLGIWRDNLKDAEAIYNVLCATDVEFTAYGIILEPVYGKEDSSRSPDGQG